ncbi:hypothetical protein F8568_026120 [Actinomadura sp. LD22]|uniref:Uncharacterized protein n=1 Tax=Actinomadura physcomitrii TaxID=2650748 RepID=A0A6I4MIJ4_9ACTN|nr:hypothetical protein [Actinomadura physcomitrii]MWA03797.1 hypothetical protein [Actinomadura physcomitrii]
MNEAAPRLAFGIGPDGTYTRIGQTFAFILGLLTTFAFLPLVVVGALLYTKAEGIFPADADRARRLVNWSWVSITVPVVLAVAGGAAAAALTG